MMMLMMMVQTLAKTWEPLVFTRALVIIQGKHYKAGSCKLQVSSYKAGSCKLQVSSYKAGF